MIQKFLTWNQWLGKRMFLITIVALAIGSLVKLQASPLLRGTVVVLFAYMTFITSLTISVKNFTNVLREPWVPLWPLFLIHCVTPFVAWTLGVIFYPDNYYIRLGYLVCAAIPVGVTSVIWTGLNKGNIALGLVTVMLDTFVVPFIMPLYFKLVVGRGLELDYGGMMLELMYMITLPSILGMVIHDWTKGKVDIFAQSIGGITSKLALFIVILINAALVAPEVSWNWSILKIMLVSLLLVSIGYLLGYWGTFAMKERTKENAIAMIYSVGLRNLSFGLVLALSYFPPEAALPVTAGILFQQPIAAAIPHLSPKLEKL